MIGVQHQHDSPILILAIFLAKSDYLFEAVIVSKHPERAHPIPTWPSQLRDCRTQFFHGLLENIQTLLGSCLHIEKLPSFRSLAKHRSWRAPHGERRTGHHIDDDFGEAEV